MKRKPPLDPRHRYWMPEDWKRGRGNGGGGVETGAQLVIDSSCVPVSAPSRFLLCKLLNGGDPVDARRPRRLSGRPEIT
jgi:hypothetical protein